MKHKTHKKFEDTELSRMLVDQCDVYIHEAVKNLYQALERIYEADATDNNGSVMGEASLCQMFSDKANYALYFADHLDLQEV